MVRRRKSKFVITKVWDNDNHGEMTMRVLVTGGMGFIGSNFLHYLLARESDVQVLNYDVLTYAGNPTNVEDLQSDDRYDFVHADVADPKAASRVFDVFRPDVVIHFAAESHVDRSIEDSSVFIRTNITGTHVLLELARQYHTPRFIQISTDEVYGALADKEEPWTEDSPVQPNSPYAASKAAAEMLVRSYHQTYGMDTIITRSSNNYGPFQFPEKFIPVCITRAMRNLPIPVYGQGLNIRDWMHVEDNCEGIWLTVIKGKPGEVYNLAGECEKRNIEVVGSVLEILGKPESLREFVKDRPGHDWRYAMRCDKAKEHLGWQPRHNFSDGLRETIGWYQKSHLMSGKL